jgi:hypothetical protein
VHETGTGYGEDAENPAFDIQDAELEVTSPL